MTPPGLDCAAPPGVPRRRVWTLRVAALAAILVTGALSTRLVAIQVVDHDRYLTLRDGQSQIRIPIQPERGRLLDRKGKELAVSRSRVPSLFAVPPEIADAKALAATLGEILRIDQARTEEVLSKRERKFVWIKRMLTETEAKAVERLGADGLGFRDEPKRFYPHGKLAAHVLGFVGIDHKGLEGAEGAFERLLGGRVGWACFGRDALKRLIALPEGPNLAPRDGKDVWLTLDATVQYIVEEELEKAMDAWDPITGCAVVMDTETGGILAMAVRPTFDPNQYGVSPVATRRNLVLTDPYEPGSIFKPLTLAMAYQEGVVRPDERFDCGGGAFTFRQGKSRRTLHDYHGYGKLTSEEVLVKSSNIGTTKIALKLGDARFRASIERFGVGRPTGIELRGEEKGWYAPKGWSFYSMTSIPWGQEVAMTPLQILTAVNVIGNRGAWVTPTVFLRATGRSGAVEVPVAEPGRTPILTEGAAALTARAMARVVEEGTGKKARSDTYTIAGKTGTKCKTEKDGTYSLTRSITSFVCFAPATNARVTVLVSLDEPRKGASAHRITGGLCAAPVAGRIVERVLEALGVAPDKEPKGKKG